MGYFHEDGQNLELNVVVHSWSLANWLEFGDEVALENFLEGDIKAGSCEICNTDLEIVNYVQGAGMSDDSP